MEFKNLKELILKFKDEDVCRHHLAERRWKGKPTCPKCKSDKVYVIENGKRYKCANNKCYHKFSVTSGTYFENTNIPLSTWFPAVYLVAAHKSGISSIQLGKDLGVTQKTAWFMLHRIRMAFKDDSIILGNTIEADETNMGGKISNKHNKERAEWAKSQDKLANKATVFAMVERDGLVITKHIDTPTKREIYPIIKEKTDFNSVVVTDTAQVYNKLNSLRLNYQVNHRNNEFVRDQWYTNTVEGFFSQLKRSVYGIYYHVSYKHLQAYCNETSYRYNTKQLNDPEKVLLALSRLDGRLTYKQLINTEKEKPVRRKASYEKKGYNTKPVIQMLDGIEVDRFESTNDAARKTGISQSNISEAARDNKKRNSAGGYQWIYS